MTKYSVLIDSQEKDGWFFSPSEYCTGSKVISLPTADYTIEGMETEFVIERKGSTGEFAKNITEARFERELARLDEFSFPFILCEFTLEDVYRFPFGSGIPSKVWPKLKVSANYIIKRIIEIETDHKVKIIFGGNQAQDYAQRLFRRMLCLSKKLQ